MITPYTLDGPSSLPLPFSSDQADAWRQLGDKQAWLDLVAPSPEECEAVSKRYGIPPEHLLAALDFNERPRVEYADDILLIIARTPFAGDTVRRSPFSTCPVAVILTPTVVVTVCLKGMLVEKLLARKILGTGPHLPERLVLTLLLRISTSFINDLYSMNEHVDHMEKALQKSMQNKELINVLHMEKALIYFLTALKGNQSVMEKIRSSGFVTATAENRNLLDDVLIENKQATDMAEIFSQIMGSLSDAFGAIVSNNLNKVMKVLTGLTIVVMIPSIIGALYGMNVPLPGQNHPYAFAVLSLLCLGLSFAVFYVLRRKDWM